MKKSLLVVLTILGLAALLAAQTHTFPALDTNNTFTGTNVFSATTNTFSGAFTLSPTAPGNSKSSLPLTFSSTSSIGTTLGATISEDALGDLLLIASTSQGDIYFPPGAGQQSYFSFNGQFVTPS